MNEIDQNLLNSVVVSLNNKIDQVTQRVLVLKKEVDDLKKELKR